MAIDQQGIAEVLEPKKIIFNAPSRQSPGFVRRQTRMIRLMRMRKLFANVGENSTDAQLEEFETIWNEMVEFLAEFIVAPTQAEKIELLNDASEEQFEMMFDALGGASKEIPPESNL